MADSDNRHSVDPVAIIGMALRFPGAVSVDEFWRNLRDGVESISFFTDEELVSSGVDPSRIAAPNYVRAKGTLEGIDMFDASFFGFTPLEAEIMDPQHRLFLECSWEVLENAGYDTTKFAGRIGVYAGVGFNTYLLTNLYPNADLIESVGPMQILISNEKDSVPTFVSYKLNLTGPSINVNTACSSSLVAVHLACQSLLNYQCDMALAGGVTIHVPQKEGYQYQEGGIGSSDGHCRAFDARADGMVSSNGVGIVVLKRLDEARADGDCIHAIIRGSAANNDGSSRVGFTAPSVDRQAEVIAEAQALAGVDPESITYIEAHGTGTALGDSIEMDALKRVFRAGTDRKNFCTVGSVKTNIGHVDTAAGVASLIKTVLALEHGMIPPNLHFERPNPRLEITGSPFFINAALREWRRGDQPRRAGVSSFGIGGTNVHLVVEEAPDIERSGTARPWQLLTLSAKTETALEGMTGNLARYLKRIPDLNIADVAYTLHVGRRDFTHRRMLVCRSIEDAASELERPDSKQVLTSYCEPGARAVAFMFPGLGDHYIGMACELYRNEPVFREGIDRCCELLYPHLGTDLREVLYPGGMRSGGASSETRSSVAVPRLDLRRMLHRAGERNDEATRRLNQTFLAQPTVFVIEYVLAQMWMEWGIEPDAMIGHSIGEYVAACLAGVMSLESALRLVAGRARMIHDSPGGSMLAVICTEDEVRSILNDELSLAAVNGPSHCVIAGPANAVAGLECSFCSEGTACRRLPVSHAFHSKMMEQLASPYTDLVRTVKLEPPRIPYLSNVTGTWITAEQATDPGYWARHMCSTVRFADGISELWKTPRRVLLEVGPGQSLGSFALLHHESERVPERAVLASLRHEYDNRQDVEFVLSALGRLWLEGVPVDWSGFHRSQRRYRIPLPTYPFERKRYWVAPREKPSRGRNGSVAVTKKSDIAEWFYIPSWKRSVTLKPHRSGDLSIGEARWLLFVDGCGVGDEIVERLRGDGHIVTTVVTGDCFDRLDAGSFIINPRRHEDYELLVRSLNDSAGPPNRIVHLWSTAHERDLPKTARLEHTLEMGFYSLLFLVQALGKLPVVDPLEMWVVSNLVQEVESGDSFQPERATLLGPCKVIPQEYPNITCRSIDIVVPEPGTSAENILADQLLAEFGARSSDLVIAYRGAHRWVETYESVRLEGGGLDSPRLRRGGTYLITGGLGRIGLTLAEYMARTVQARLILTTRSGLPMRKEWDGWLKTHGARDETSIRIRRVQQLEEAEGEVLVMQADASREEEMRRVMVEALDRFGEIHGVIHAAGVTDSDRLRPIAELDRTDCDAHFNAKIHGVYVLEKLLGGRQLDFCLLTSSLSSVLGGLGFAAHSAANIFMDMFAKLQKRKNGPLWTSLNWAEWGAEDDRPGKGGLGTTIAGLEITPEEGMETFKRVLSINQIPQIVISSGDLHARINQWIKLQPIREVQKLERDESRTYHPRPNVRNPYVECRNEVERSVGSIWKELLGIEQIGRHDNFFEMGGHSLLGIQLVSRLRKAFQVEVSIRSLFEKPTIAGLSETLVKSEKRPGQVEKIARLRKQIDRMAPDEIERLIREKEGGETL